MNAFDQFWATTVDIVWGLPLVIFILLVAIYFSIISRLKPISGFFHAFQILYGKYDNKNLPSLKF